MSYITKALVLGLVLSGASATTVGAAPKKAAVEDQTKYCMQIEAFTGTRIIRTECRTKAEWANIGVDVDEATRK